MLSDGISTIGDGLLEVAEERLKGLIITDDINNMYDVEQTPFARGKFAAVRRAIHKNSGVHFAAKFLRRRRRAQSSDKEIKHEIAVLILCSGCENIVKLNEVYESRSETALLLELATGGELQAILDNEGSLTEAQTRICMRQVLKALQFLHKRSVAHLDLKPQNILLTGARVEDGLKLCDFGISRIIENGSKIREILGTPDYVAPEVLQYEPLSLQTDIWSVGVLTYVLLSGCSPFGGDTKQETFLNISQCALTFPDELFEGVSQYAIDFIKSTLRIKPFDRLTALECLEHIWLKDELPISNNIFTLSSTSGDLTEHDDADTNSENNCDDTDEGQTKPNNCSQYISEVQQQENRNQKNSSRSCHDNKDNNKENFLKNSTTTTITNNISTNIGINYSVNFSKLSAITKTTNGTVKYNNTNYKLSNSVNCPTIVMYQNSSNLNNSIDKIQKITEKSVELTANLSKNTNANNTKIATATICLFPDAPTTPKVIRKTPFCSSKSVKALVKKFQLESGENNLYCNETDINNDDSTTASKLINNNNNGNYSSNSDKKNSNNSSITSKICCSLCLKYGGPGCRHSGATIVNKSTSTISVDQGKECSVFVL